MIMLFQLRFLIISTLPLAMAILIALLDFASLAEGRLLRRIVGLFQSSDIWIKKLILINDLF